MTLCKKENASELILNNVFSYFVVQINNNKLFSYPFKIKSYIDGVYFNKMTYPYLFGFNVDGTLCDLEHQVDHMNIYLNHHDMLEEWSCSMLNIVVRQSTIMGVLGLLICNFKMMIM